MKETNKLYSKSLQIVRNLCLGFENKKVDLTQIGNRELFAPRDNTDNCWLLYPGLTVTVLGNSEQFFLAFWTNICFTTFTTTYNEFEFSLLWMIHSDIKSVLWEFFSIVNDPSYPILPQIAWIFAIYPYKTFLLYFLSFTTWVWNSILFILSVGNDPSPLLWRPPVK